jgi:transcriptional regulator with XRE-family HTH domain
MDSQDSTADLPAVSAARLWCRSGLARTIREQAGLTLAEMGSLAGASTAAVYRWEAGQRTPRGVNAARYYRALIRAQELTAAANEAESA